jgi:uncharacterized BrkB/YihY/UPF0761 family membrane protein
LDETSEPAEHEPVAAKPRRLHDAWGRIDATRVRFVSSRRRYRPLDLALTLSEHDIATGGALMAGALAFRLFLWSLPAALLGVGLLGFDENAAQDASDAGMGRYTANVIGAAAQEAHRGRWLAVIIGALLLIVVSYTLAKTVVVATALIWGEPVRKPSSPVRAVVAVLGTVALALGASLVTAWMRKDSPGIGLTATILVGVVWAVLWWLVSTWLPRPAQLPWWALLPGAALVGVGAQVLHLATIFYFSARISHASQLYGSLGAAATMLLWTYVVARLLLGSAALNVVVLRVYVRRK